MEFLHKCELFYISTEIYILREVILKSWIKSCYHLGRICCRDEGGRDSSVGIATPYGLDGPWIESSWGARFFAPVQTGPGTHPASCTMGTGSFSGVKSGRAVTLTPHPLLVPLVMKE